MICLSPFICHLTMVVADTQHRRLREMSTATALKKLSDLHKMETDELYCQMIGMLPRIVVQRRVRVAPIYL